MITHHLGTDTRIAYDWCDSDGALIIPDSAEFSINGVPVDPQFSDPDPTPEHSTYVHISDTADLPVGNHTYRLTATKDGDTVILGDGLLRVKP